MNFESFQEATTEVLLRILSNAFKKDLEIEIQAREFAELHEKMSEISDKKFVFIIDEIEGLNPGLFNQFLHTICDFYHNREDHSLKSVILVGVTNVVGLIQDNASPFNIADNLPIPHFTKEETYELLAQHEQETG